VLGENLELPAVEVFLFVLGVSDEEQDEVLGMDVIVDDAGAAAFAPTLGGSAQFAKAATAGNHVARVRVDGELHLQFQDVRLR